MLKWTRYRTTLAATTEDGRVAAVVSPRWCLGEAWILRFIEEYKEEIAQVVKEYWPTLKLHWPDKLEGSLL